MYYMGPLILQGMDISQSVVKYEEYPAFGQYPQPYLVGGSSDVAFHCQYCSNVFIVFCSVAAAESSCMVDSGVSPSAAVSKSSEPTSVDYSTTEYLPQSAEGDDVAVEQSMIDRDASVSERPSVATPYDLVEGTVDCQVGIWTSFNLLFILTKQLNI